MDNFKIKVFRVLASNLNLSRASQALCLSRQSVTQHVKTLEEELGSALFVRKGNSIALTAAGQALLPFAEKIESICNAAQGAVAGAGGARERRLALGASTTIVQYLLPYFIANFAAENPQISITVNSGNTDSVLAALKRRRIQLALVEQPSDREELHIETFLHDRMVLAVPPNHQWAGHEIDVCRLKGEPFLMREMGSGSRRAVEAALARAGFTKQDLAVEMEFDSTEGLLNAVEAGLGVAIISRQAVKNRKALGGVKLVKVRGLHMSNSMFIASRSAESPACEAAVFRSFLLSEARRLTGPNLFVLPRPHGERTDSNVEPIGQFAEQIL